MNCPCERFKVGDIVTFGIVPNSRFYGTVTQIEPKIKKIFVDVNGKVAQFDPEEINVVLEQALMKQARRASIKKALYWSQSPRKYKKTQVEENSGEMLCPKCKSTMNTSRYTRNNKLHVCPDCDFKITSSDIVVAPEPEQDEVGSPVDNIVNDIRMSYIAKRVAQVSPLRDRMDYGEQGNMNSRIEDMQDGQSRLDKIAKKLMAVDYDYQYDPEHKTKPSGGGWEKTEKGWSKEQTVEKKDDGKEEKKPEKTKSHGGHLRETPEEAGLQVVEDKGKELKLYDKETNTVEVYVKNNDFAGAGVEHKGNQYEWTHAIDDPKEVGKLVNKKNTKKSKPYKKMSPKKGTLDPVQNILKNHGLDNDSDEIKELTGFKNSIKNHQRLTQDAAEKMKTQGPKFWPRNAEKLKKEFIKNMDASNYSSPEAFKKAQDRLGKMPPADFAKILATITDEEEI